MFSTVFLALVALLVCVVAYLLLTGGIDTRGLLSSRPDRLVEADRLQSLVVSLTALATYASSALVAGAARSLPEVPAPWLIGFAGSQLLFLAGKYIRSFK